MPELHAHTSTTHPLAYTDVYIDDFKVVAQPPTHLQTLNKVLHTIDSVFTDHPHTCRRAVVSSKKIAKGDAAF